MAQRRVIWSFTHAGRPDYDQARRIIDLGVEMGIHGIEIESDLESVLTYEAMPHLARGVNRAERLARREVVRRIACHARQRGLHVGQWLHELSGPRGLLDLWPQIRAEDGFLDLESPLIRELVAAQLKEFFAAVPEVDEVVLTLTETQVCVLHRPYSKMPLKDRARRMLEAVADGLRPLGKGLVVRPFSALREDYEAVLAAVKGLSFEPLAVMEKTEPFDWNPFLPDSPYLRPVGGLELRAEADAGAEYYGQTAFPACYAHYLVERLRSALDRGATVFVLRADRDNRIAPGTLNEINLVAATKWALDPSADLDAVWSDWLHRRLGAAPDGLAELLEQTFEVIKKTLFIDRQQISHHRFPSFEHAKHVQVFHLFERCRNLGHMRDHWSMIADRRTLSHAEIVEEKAEAVEMARSLETWFERMAAEMPPDSAAEVRQALGRLEWVARGAQGLVRLVAAHLEDAWAMRPRAVASFGDESAAFLALADDIARAEGEGFFKDMPARMRGFVQGLREERAVELPRRRALAAEAGLLDCVLCGLASEGHKLAKRLHTGAAVFRDSRYYRATGLGDGEGFSYELAAPEGQKLRVEMTVVGSGGPAPAEARLGPHRHEFEVNAPDSEAREVVWRLSEGVAASPARIEVRGSGVLPCRVSEIRVYGE